MVICGGGVKVGMENEENVNQDTRVKTAVFCVNWRVCFPELSPCPIPGFPPLCQIYRNRRNTPTSNASVHKACFCFKFALQWFWPIHRWFIYAYFYVNLCVNISSITRFPLSFKFKHLKNTTLKHPFFWSQESWDKTHLLRFSLAESVFLPRNLAQGSQQNIPV